jgi:hypothetical protein
MCGKILKNFDSLDCKIITFGVKNWVDFAPCQIRSADFESSWLTFLSITQSCDFWCYFKKLTWESFSKTKSQERVIFILQKLFNKEN